MNLVRNERTKLLAGTVNTIGNAFITAGVVAPLVAAFYGIGGAMGSFPLRALLIGTLVWFSVGMALHFVARRLLGRLRE